MPKPLGVTRQDLDRWCGEATARAATDPVFLLALTYGGMDVLDAFCAGRWLHEQLSAAGASFIQIAAILDVVCEPVFHGTDIWALMQSAVDRFRQGRWPLTADELAASAGIDNVCASTPPRESASTPPRESASTPPVGRRGPSTEGGASHG